MNVNAEQIRLFLFLGKESYIKENFNLVTPSGVEPVSFLVEFDCGCLICNYLAVIVDKNCMMHVDRETGFIHANKVQE